MGVLDDAVKGWGGVLVGAGTALAATSLLPTAGSTLRPLAKALVRAALLVSESVQALVAEVTEQMGDLVAEVRAERAGQPPEPGRSRRTAVTKH